MAPLLALLLLAAPCEGAAPLKAGDAVPCDGILWSSEQSKRAVELKRVTLPVLEAELEEAKARAQAARAEAKAARAQAAASDKLLAAELLKPPVEPPPCHGWRWGVGGLGVGLIVGAAGFGFYLLKGAP